MDGVFYCHVNLAWSDVQASIREKKSKSSTIIHEFVHAFDNLRALTHCCRGDEDWRLKRNEVIFCLVNGDYCYNFCYERTSFIFRSSKL